MASPGDPFTLYEENGEAYVFFEATDPDMRISIKSLTTEDWPTTYTLRQDDCNSSNIFETGAVPEDNVEMLMFRFYDLSVGEAYAFSLSGANGFFEFESVVGVIRSVVANQPNSCNVTGGCNVVPNPGLETPDGAYPLPVGEEHPLLNPQQGNREAYIDEACDWDYASIDAANTPDYYLGGLHPNFSNYATIAPCNVDPNENGNECAGQGNSGSDGYFRLLSTRTDITAERREYVYTRLKRPLQPGHLYYVQAFMQHVLDRDTRSRAYQILFPENTNILPVSQPGLITTLGTPQVNMSTSIALGTATWQEHKQIFQYQGVSNADNMVIGNFLNNSNTAPLTQNGFTTVTTPLDTRPAAWFDDFRVIDLGGPGEDQIVCQPNQTVSLGIPSTCPNPNTSYLWTDAQGNTIGTTIPITVNSPMHGVTDNYFLTITRNGVTYTSQVNVSTAEQTTITDIQVTNCNSNNTATYQLNQTNVQLTNLNVTSSTNLSYSSLTLDHTGLLTINNTQILNGAQMGSLTISANFQQATGAPSCTRTFDINYFDCCRTFTNPYTYTLNGTSFTDYSSSLNIQNHTFAVYGSLFIDDDFNFTNCDFYMMPDAQIIITANVDVGFNNCNFEACGEYKWDRIYHNQSSSTLSLIGCRVRDALRGIHSTDDAELTLTKNVFSYNIFGQIVQDYFQPNKITWAGNRYELYEESQNTSQAPNSTVVMPLTSTNGNFRTVGIQLNNASQQQVIENSFWTDDNNPEYGIHVWCKNFSQSEINKNAFHEGFNIFIEDASDMNIFTNRFEKLNSGQQLNTRGIALFNSKCLIENNTLLDGAYIISQEPLETKIIDNYIDYNSSNPAITVASSTLNHSAYVLIDINKIHNYTGISVQNIETTWPTNTNGNRVVINKNDVFITQELGNYSASGHIWGISAIDCDGVSIGENTIVCDYDTGNGVPLPGAVVNNITVNTDKTVGIWVDNCQDAMVGCNETHFFGQGIHLQGDVSGTTNPNAPHQYSNNTMASCYNGLFLEVGLIADHFGSQNGYGVDNLWPSSTLSGPNIPLNSKIFDNRSPFSNPLPSIINYYNSGGIYNPQLFNTYFQSIGNATANNCSITIPPANKTNTNRNEIEKYHLVVYPNPVSDVLSIKTDIDNTPIVISRLINSFGQDLELERLLISNKSIDVASLNNGVYLLEISVQGKKELIKFVKH